MKYKGAEITEMTPDQWDGKSREMLCWHVEPKSGDSDAFFKEVIVGYYNNHWHSSLGYRYAHCAEIPQVKVQQTVSLDECIEEAKVEFEAYPTNPNCEAAIMAYSTKMYLEDLKLKESRIDTAIKLIQNDQAFMAMDVLKGEDDSLLDTNPLKDYPPEDLDEQGYRKVFDTSPKFEQKLFSEYVEAQQAEIKNLEKSNSKLHCYLLHALSEVFRMKYELAFDFEYVDTNDWLRKKKRYMRRKDMLFRKHLAYLDAYKEAKKKLKEHR